MIGQLVYAALEDIGVLTGVFAGEPSLNNVVEFQDEGTRLRE